MSAHAAAVSRDGTLHLSLDKRPLHNRMSVMARYALAREILRCAQDDTKKVSLRGCHSERKLLERRISTDALASGVSYAKALLDKETANEG
jgi:hypothetical protein